MKKFSSQPCTTPALMVSMFISVLQTIAATLKEGYCTFLKSRKRKVKNSALIPLHDILGHKSRGFYFPRSCQLTIYSSLLKYSTL